MSRSRGFYTTARLLHEAGARGLDASVIHPESVVTRDGREVSQGAARARKALDLIIPRISSRTTRADLDALDALRDSGGYCPVSSDALSLAQDKLSCSQTLRRFGLPQLPIKPVRCRADVNNVMSAWGCDEIVLKPRRGTQGRGVARVSVEALQEAQLSAYFSEYGEVVAQPFVTLTHPRDLRVLVMEGEPLAHCLRIATPGEFRTNVHLGARTEATAIDQATQQLAVAACEALNLSFGGVDLLPTSDGYVILEVNGSPGLEGIERATGRNLAAEVIGWFLRRQRRLLRDKPTATTRRPPST